MLQPVGPLPPSVYWRRRVAALTAAIVLLGMLGWGGVALAGLLGGSGEDGAEPGPGSFSAAEQDHRELAHQERLQQERAQQGRAQAGVEPPPGPEAPQAPAPAPSPGAGPPAPPLDDPASGLLRPPTGAARALLPGAVLGTTPPPTPTPPSAPTPAEPSSPSPPASPDSPAPAADPAPPAARCPDDVLTVTAGTDEPRYAPGSRPDFSLVVTNTGDVACTRDLAAARQAVAVVRTPGDGLWSSDDCGAPATKAPDVRRLAPGEAATFRSSWSGRTSLPGCTAPREIVPPGRYQLLARLDTMISEPVPFTVG